MSYPINLLLSQSEITLKTFIKEKNEPFSLVDKQEKSQLRSFEGNELKKAYEEIISEKSRQPDSDVVKSQNTHVSVEAIVKKNKINHQEKIKKTTHDNIEKNVNVLFKAIESGDEDIIKKINSENVNIADQFGWTPLMVAAGAGRIDIVDFLLKLGACKTVKDKSGLTAIDIALRKNNLDIVNLLKQWATAKKKVIDKNKKTSDNIVQNKSEDKLFYCDVCKMSFSESSKKNHQTSIVHTFNCQPKLSPYYGISKANKGYQMLLNTGWNEDGGLGPSGEGQKYPVKTVLKRDRKGLGQLKNKTARITHFDPKDPRAVENVKKNESRVYRLRERKLQLKKESQKDRALRRALS